MNNLILALFKKLYHLLRIKYHTIYYNLCARKKKQIHRKRIQQALKFNKRKKTVINKIGFYILCENHLAHLLPIVKHLPKEAFDIITQDLEAPPDYLKLSELPVRCSADILINSESYIVVVSLYMVEPWWFIEASVPKNYNKSALGTLYFKHIAETNVRMVYSLGAMTWNVSNVMKHYDSLFVYGPHEEEMYKKHFGDNMKIYQVGYPKFDDFFNNNLPKIECEKKLNKNLKTILWLPTKNLLSSIPKYSDTMKRLSSKYNVILKPHPQENSQFLKSINHSNIILSEHHDSAPFYKLADFVFCDYGGSAFGAIYCDKPVVFLSPDNPEKDLINYLTTSPEVFLRNYFLTLNNESENEIVSCLEDKNYWLSDSNIRAKLREQFFLKNFGNSGKTAAIQLKKFLRSQ